MRVLVVGSGGREHALVWKLAQSPEITKLFCAPGNGGIGDAAELVDVGAEDVEALTEFAENKDIDL
ncbi:MAG: phosphoribosylamine--glycine ligase family protein, partial [Candidatus Omnitrophota bacterium]|nr:phosphoribosylamine--glycine ligase family protein [Candidatus Omnitrophota bacterium]